MVAVGRRARPAAARTGHRSAGPPRTPATARARSSALTRIGLVHRAGRRAAQGEPGALELDRDGTRRRGEPEAGVERGMRGVQRQDGTPDPVASAVTACISRRMRPRPRCVALTVTSAMRVHGIVGVPAGVEGAVDRGQGGDRHFAALRASRPLAEVVHGVQGASFVLPGRRDGCALVGWRNVLQEPVEPSRHPVPGRADPGRHRCTGRGTSGAAERAGRSRQRARERADRRRTGRRTRADSSAAAMISTDRTPATASAWTEVRPRTALTKLPIMSASMSDP